MRVYYYLTIITLLIGLQVPALAIWNIPSASDAPKQPNLPVVQQNSAWLTSMPRRQGPVNAIIVNKPVTPVINKRSCWTERTSATTVVRNDYMKSAEDVKVMNQVFRVPGSTTPVGVVPEPGSIIGLSTGVLGLLFQVRRTRKKA